MADGRGVNESLRLELVLDVVDPIQGRIRAPGRPERPFLGWLQLLSALEAIRSETTGRK
jgi:hypothetical protein